MNEKPNLTIYLAGPVSNCNEWQKTEWRKSIKTMLARLGHKCIDPTDHAGAWTPFKEMVEIDRSDVVIANLWRESVGTVVGIVQARRKGKPVILIDPNYLKSYVLEQIVGKDLTVHDIEKAVNKLPQVYEQFSKAVTVRKSNGDLEPFTFPKLHDSLYAVCAKAHIEDVVLPDFVAHEVHRAVRKTERSGEIKSEQIKRLIFETLNNIARDNENELTQCAVKLRLEWEEYEKVKKDQRVALELMKEVEENNESLKTENASLKQRLDEYKSRPKAPDALPQELKHPDSLVSVIERALGKKRALCVCRVGKALFSSAFERRGLAQNDFTRLFETKALEGKQSNLNHDLKSWLSTYSCVLYAWDGLRHVSPTLGKMPNLISGAAANDVVQRFLERVQTEETTGEQ